MSSTSTSTSNSNPNSTPEVPKPTLQEQLAARKQAHLDYLHNNDKINGREPPVIGANNRSKNTGYGENQPAGRLASAGNAITGLFGALGN